MFCFDCGRSRQLLNDRLTFQRINRVWHVIVDEKELYSVNHKASISRRVSAFSFNFIDYLLIDLLSSTIEKIAHRVKLEATARKVFEIKKFADTLLFLSIRNSSNLHTLLIRWNVSRSFWSSRLLTTSAAFGKQKSKTNMILSNSTFYNLSTDI